MKPTDQHKQAFWFSFINYIGIVIGLLSTVYVYPNNKSFLGMVRYVDAVAQILYPILLFGGAQALIHFYPNNSAKNQSKLFLYSVYAIALLSVFVFLFLFFGENILSVWIKKGNYSLFFYAFPIAVFLAFVELFKRQATNMQKLAIPTLFEKIIPKIALPIVFILLIYNYLTESKGLLVFIFSYFVLFVLLAFYVLKRFPIQITFNFNSLFTKISKKEYYNYCFYSFIASFGSFFAFRLDAFMIPEFLNFEANGTYNIGVTLASALAVPATGLFAISAPLISSYIKKNEIELLGKKYIETAKFLFFIGTLFYGFVFFGIHSFFQLLPTYDKLVDSIPIIFILGANVVFNMATGFSNEIISFSKYYRFNIVLILILMGINIGLNYYFLTQTSLGLVGVAIASLLAMTFFNVAKLIFIYKKFQILPFNKKYSHLIIVFFALLFSIKKLPIVANNFVELVTKTALFGFIYIFIIYKMKLVYTLNLGIDKLFKKQKPQ